MLYEWAVVDCIIVICDGPAWLEKKVWKTLLHLITFYFIFANIVFFDSPDDFN